jgi:hypothetical protein
MRVRASCLMDDPLLAMGKGGEGGGPSKKAVPGSKDWQAQKDKEAQQLDGDDSRRTTGVVASIIGAKNSSSAWSIVSSSASSVMDEEDDEKFHPNATKNLSESPWLFAVVSNRSIIASSNVVSKIPEMSLLAGVAYSATVVGAKRTMVSCEGVTLFPAGQVWISRALLCIGKRLASNAETIVERENESQQGRISEKKDVGEVKGISRLQRCRDIRERLRGLKDRYLAPSNDLIELIDGLFADFLSSA